MIAEDDPTQVASAPSDLAALSLQDLDGQDWGDPDPDETYLVRTCTLLHRQPLGKFSDEDARIMIGQRIGLEVLIPLALAMLGQQPLAEGDLYPGALLGAVVDVPGDYWTAHPEQRMAVAATITQIDPADLEVSELVVALSRFQTG